MYRKFTDLSKLNTVYVDGTLKCCFTKLFHEVYYTRTSKWTYIPVVFFLLSDNQANTYVNSYNCIENLLSKLNINFNPEIIVLKTCRVMDEQSFQ